MVRTPRISDHHLHICVCPEYKTHSFLLTTACVDFISATYMQLEPLLQRSSDPTYRNIPSLLALASPLSPNINTACSLLLSGHVRRFIQARISIVNWYKLLLSEARVKRQCSKPPLSVSLRLSSGIRDEGVKVVDHTQESVERLRLFFLNGGLLLGLLLRSVWTWWICCSS
jgi:hypothetical protein